MNKRTARRLAAATALALPGTVGVHAIAHAAPMILTPRANSAVGGRSVTIFAQFAAPRPVASVKIYLDQLLLAKRTFHPESRNGSVNLTWDSTVALPGTHQLVVMTYDASGQLLGREAIPISVSKGASNGNPSGDTVPPQVAIIAPTPSMVLQGTFDVKVLATDDSGVEPYVSVFVDKELRGVSNHQPYSFSIDTSQYNNGTHSIEAWARDGASNKTVSNTVAVRFSNPGGATALNEDVNRMGAEGAKDAASSAITTTGPILPAVPAPAEPSTTAAPAPATPNEAAQPMRLARADAPKAANPAEKPAPVPAARIALPAKTGSVPASKLTAPKSPAKASQIPVVHIPPVRRVSTTLKPESVDAPAEPVSQPSAPAQVQEVPVETPAPVQIEETTPAPEATVSIQELPAETEAPAAGRDASGIEELPEVTVTAPAKTAVKPAPARTRIAKALPGETAPRPAPKVAQAAPQASVARPAAAKAPKPAVRAASPAKSAAPIAAKAAQAALAAAAPLADASAEPATPAQPAPIVLKMRGDKVLETSPAKAAPVAEKTRIARADVPARPAEVTAAIEPGNPVPAAHVAAAPKPTAPAVRVEGSARHEKLARAVPSVNRPVAHDLRPEGIRELPADRVQDGRIRHAVRPGETMTGLARRYGVPLKQLMAANRIGRRNAPLVGQVLTVPAPFRVALNDAPVPFDVAPRIQNGVTLAALRQVYEQSGGHLTWDPARRQVRATGAGSNIVVNIGSNTALVNGRRVSLSVPAYIVEGRTFLPVAFIADALDLKAEYDLRSGAINLASARIDASALPAEPRKS